MSNTELFLDRPWLLLLAIPALLMILIPYFRLNAKRRRSFRKLAPMVLHCLIALLLVLILAQAAIVRTTDSQAVILVLDLSHSTQRVRENIQQKALQIMDMIDKRTPVGVVAFGDDCVYDAGPEGLTPVRTDASNIGAALEYAYSQLPEQRAGRIILMSDGKQTDGDADSTAQYLQSQGVRIDAVYFDTDQLTAEVQVSALTAPDRVYAGQDVTLTAELRCNTFTNAVLSLYDNGTLLSTTETKLVVGSNMVELTAPIDDLQPHTYRLVIEPERDTLPENNEALAYVTVADQPSVLLIAGKNAQTAQLEQLLQEKNHVTTVSASKAPRSLTNLCDYDGVILCNVNARDLPKEYDSLLEEYVRRFGRSLLAVGGENTYMYGNMQDTALEEMMPVRFSLSRSSEDDPVALILVIDCSLSMSQQSTYMSVAKQGAIKCVEAMTDNDYVGIISFNRTAAVEAELTQNDRTNKDSLNRIISGLTTSQGTYYTDALALAHEQLNKSDVSTKHVLFVSDGSPADVSYQNLIPQMVADGISISTIGLGYSSSLLEAMASSSGGQYYFVDEASNLPDIMLTLTEQISVNSLITGSFSPLVAQQTALTQGLDALPPLDGYLGTTVKQGAQAPITTDQEHPIYATWQYGAGTVSCFTSDLGPQWCGPWLESEAGRSLILRMVSATLGSTRQDSSLTAQYTRQAKSAMLTVHTAEAGEYSLTVTAGDAVYPMQQIKAGVYQVSLPTPEAGVYPVTVTQTRSNGHVLDTLDHAVVASWSTEYDAFSASGETLMHTVCSYSGGTITEDLQVLADIRAEAVQVVFDFMLPFGIIIFISLLADITIRRLRWKDIKNYWLMFKYRKL